MQPGREDIQKTWKSMLEIALKAAKAGGEVLSHYFETSIEKRVKDDLSFVTKADVEAEAKIREVIASKFPEHTFVGEESGVDKKESSYQWYVDPLDGTINFANGLPIFAVSIGLAKGDELVACVIHNPVTNSLFYAEKGKGAFWNEEKISVSNQDATKAMITIGRGKKEEDKAYVNRIFTGALKHIKTVRYLGSAALEMAYLARGGTEGYVNLGTQKWDYAAGALLVQEAGGTITDLEGNPWSMEQNYFVASNGIAHNDLLKVVNTLS